jgi:signal transduction histidine kinase
MEPVLQEEALERVIEDMALLVEREAMGKGVAIVRAYAPELPLVRTDVPLLRQVVLNLLTNALQATPQGGTITLSTRRDEARAHIVGADTGAGIASENLAKIFDPFFTTKEPGQGTGLGLSLSHGIVERLGGTLTVDSAPGQGATFTVSLPL